MAKTYLTIFVLLILSTQIKAQQYGLFNTRTLFDAFENPAQPAFALDSSRQYASNFLLPYFGLNAANKGESNYVLSDLINHGKYNTDNVPIGNNNRNKIYENSNVYLLTFRIFQSYKYHKELGFSWQVRTDGYADYTNETLVAFGDYSRFTSTQNGLFNGHGYGQSYHQFSMTYRENVDKRLSFGVKLSLLSGITYNKVDITQSDLAVDPATNSLSVGLSGNYESNYLRASELSAKSFLPDFKNPGLSAGFGTTYNAKSGVTIIANVKDLGFIRWNKDSHAINISNQQVTVAQDPSLIPVDPLLPSPNTLDKELENLFINADKQKSFYTPTNAKADFLVSKTFGSYQPNFIVSKNLFYAGGDVAFVNTMKFGEYSASLTPAYNMIGFMMLGLQGMYQTPNFEFFLGSDNLLRTAKIKQVASVSSGYTGASVYLGLAIKFGYVVEHPQNSSYMPGVGDGANETGFFHKLFRMFKKDGD